LNETASHENPLVPNKKLLQIYTAIVEMRLLDEYAATLHRKEKLRKRPGSVRGEEACRVSTAVELHPGDLVSDTQPGSAMGLLFGAKVDSLLRHISIDRKKKERAAAIAEDVIARRQLPWIGDVEDRLRLALGAALACKTLKQSNIVVAYIDRTEVPKGLWKSSLALAGKLELPIIFVVLPERGKKKTGVVDLCVKARSAGVPGIPVDANDAVALYRVAQESIGRTRGGDGPVLIDCVAAPSRERHNEEASDPVAHLKYFLLGRKICTEALANHTGDALRKKIAAATR
jgi:TPP-dependent pyruvate/acetoin dehydrogenase alpha subunit